MGQGTDITEVETTLVLASAQLHTADVELRQGALQFAAVDTVPALDVDARAADVHPRREPAEQQLRKVVAAPTEVEFARPLTGLVSGAGEVRKQGQIAARLAGRSRLDAQQMALAAVVEIEPFHTQMHGRDAGALVGPVQAAVGQAETAPTQEKRPRARVITPQPIQPTHCDLAVAVANHGKLRAHQRHAIDAGSALAQGGAQVQVDTQLAQGQQQLAGVTIAQLGIV